VKLSSTNSNTSRNPGRLAWRLLGLAVAGLVVLCHSVSVFAIDPNRMLSQYIHNFWGTEKGFPGGSVTSIAQTPDGYLWIGTDRGLIRFDGINFHIFEAGPAIPTIGPVRKLLVDGQGTLWILLQNTKLLRYRGETFNLVRGEAENGITAIGEGAGNAVLLSSLAMGILVYKDGSFVHASGEASAPGQDAYQTAADFSWSTSIAPHRLIEPTAAVISLAASTDGKIWLGTQDRGILFLDGGKVHTVTPESSSLRVNCFLPLQNHELWIGTNQGALLWNGAELTREGIPSSLRNVDVLSMVRDRDSNIWVGTTRTLIRVNQSGVSSLAQEIRSGDDRTTALFEDREGNLWIGGAQHLERLRDSAFVTYSLPRQQSTGTLYADSNDYTWIAAAEGGLWRLKAGEYEAVAAAGLAADVVYSITSAGSDGLWIGRQQGGLSHLQYVKGALIAKTYTQHEGLAQNSVYTVLEGRDRTIWAGTLTGGVSELRNGHFTNYTTTDGLASNTVSSITEGTDGTIWFGTPNGLTEKSANGWRTYRIADGLPSADIDCLFEDSTGVIWIGTAEGLAFFSGGRIHTLAAEPDSLHEPIFGIAEDENRWLWIATADHVLQVSPPTSNNKGVTDVREYGLADGLLGTEGVKRSKSLVVDSHGRIWFSTNRGVSVVNPARGTVNPTPVLVQIEAVIADGNALKLGSSPKVPPGPEKITFRFVGLSLANEERVRYRYRLDNFDTSWSEPGITREATYNRLAPGPYRFRVDASNSDGLWNGTEAAIDFKVEPELWQTWWFRLAVVLSAGFMALTVYRVRMRQLARLLGVRFEERLAERTRVAQDLHDTLLQGIYSASLHFDLANNRVPEDSPAKPAIERGLDLLRQVSQEGRNALRSLRSRQRGSDGLEQALSLLSKEFDLPESIDFLVATEGQPRALRPLVRDEAYLIAREAVINAFRHAQASKIEVEVGYASRHLRVLVRDNGCGIDSQLLRVGREGHWGLAGMRERAEKIGGKLTVLSGVDAGTEMELSVPGALAFQDGSANRLWAWLPRLYPWRRGSTLQKSSGGDDRSERTGKDSRSRRR
jgi:ligand-binding sensor domain-containing protein/signal transduction histidine kinase